MIDPPPTIEHVKNGRGRRAALLVSGAALALAASCGGDAPGAQEPPYSALLVTLDTTRADALTPYGNRPEVTPGLARLAKESLVYERAHTVTPLTLPSHTSMLTGLYPPRHTVRDNGLWALPTSADTLAERAKERGYSTAAFLAAVVLDGSFGLAQGFDTYVTPIDKSGGGTTHVAERPANEVVDDAIQWLSERKPDEPFFLWVHVFDPHGPHEPPTGFRDGALAKNPYHGEVAYADSELTRLFDWMRARDLLDETYVAVAADHGEAFGDNGVWSHGQFCYESTMRVPMLLRDPAGDRAGLRSRETVSVVDLYPTLAESMGIAPSATIDGVSLFRRTVPADRGVYVEAYNGFLAFGWSPLVGWIQGDRKYLHSSEPELFDLSVDMTEARNLYSVRQEEAEEYRRQIALLYQREALVNDGESTSADVLEQIRNLGYATVSVAPSELPHPLEPSDLPSPPSMIAAHRKTLSGMSLNNANRLEEAEVVLTEVLDDFPENHFVRNMLGFCLMKQERHAEAIPFFQAVTAKGPQWADTYSNLGICLAVNKRFEEAEAAFRQALQLDPNKLPAIFGLSQLLKRLGRDEESAELRARWETLQGR